MRSQRPRAPSKLTRQLMLTFFLLALLPVSILSLVAANYLTDNAREQAESSVESEARTRAFQVLERLLQVSKELTSDQSAGTVTVAKASQLLASAKDGNQPQAIAGEWRTQLQENRPLLRTGAVGIDGTAAAHMLVNPPDNHDTKQLRWTKIETDQILGTRDSRNLYYDTCIFSNELKPLFVTQLQLCQQLAQEFGEALMHKGNIYFTAAGSSYLAHYRSLFLRHQFASDDWKVVVIQRHKELISDSLLFRKNFLALAIAVILALSLGSNVVIRKRMAPLHSIMDGIRRVSAQDYSTPVSVHANNEFGDLASAFNKMSTKVDSQLSMLATLAEFDQSILSSISRQQILEVIATKTASLLPADFVSLLSLDDASRRYQLVQPAGAGEADRSLPNSALEKYQSIFSSGEKLELQRQTAGNEVLFALMPKNISFLTLLPIHDNKGLQAIILLGHRAMPKRDPALDSVARTFADRIAVALNNADSEARLYHQAHYDLLSDLPNRLSMQERLRSNIVETQNTSESFALLFIDLDDFKLVNDSLGHQAGDQLIKALAHRLSATIGPGDLVARMGGDEFVIVSRSYPSHLEALDAIASLAGEVMRSISKPLEIKGREIRSGSSIGIVLYPQHGKSADELLQNADTAMYHAKSKGRNNFQFFSDALNTASRELMRLSSELKRALQNNEFILHYQPKLDLNTGKIVGAEALIRWLHPERGLVAPGEFIEAAERMGLIKEIGDWTLAETGRQLTRWRAAGLAAPRISVNISATQIQEDDIADKVTRWLHHFQLDPGLLELEIVESVLLDDMEASSMRLRQLRQLGIHISVDDYGTGYSSLSYIRSFPVDCLKIDRCFITNLCDNPADQAIVESSIILAHKLGMSVIAEGVETRDQLDLLQELGCDQIQGYYFGKPMPAQQFADFLAAHRNSSLTVLRGSRNR